MTASWIIRQAAVADAGAVVDLRNEVDGTKTSAAEVRILSGALSYRIGGCRARIRTWAKGSKGLCATATLLGKGWS